MRNALGLRGACALVGAGQANQARISDAQTGQTQYLPRLRENRVNGVWLVSTLARR